MLFRLPTYTYAHMQGMLSCASPASMPPAHRSMHGQPWSALTLPSNTIKSEPPESMEESGFTTTQQTSGFCSDDFPNGSPSSSSKDSNEHSPQSVGSNGENFYDCTNLKAKTNMGVNFNYTRNETTYNLIMPSSFEFRSHDAPMKQETSPNFEATYSPRTLAPPAHVSTPLQRADVTPPMSPATPDKENRRRSFDGLHDSGFEGQAGQVVRNDSDDVRDGFSLDEDFENEASFRVPALNSHGKVKTFKCKQCNFVTTIKVDIWEHYKQHIKPEKMLQCYKCPFVTEYKHHLEYHMRNHAGSKPYKCDKCTYTCVNKSMLNSHLKSHSNVYQYRCNDCDYASKYCHSLKLHLRKYKHRPGTVLNMDGSVNPLPIIDVYGTRRGPKQKPMSKPIEQEVSVNNNNQPPQLHTHALFSNHYPVGLPYLPQLLTPPFYLPPNNNYDRRSPSEISTENQAVMSSLAPLLPQRLPSVDRVTNTNRTSPANQSPISRELIPHSPPAPPNNDALDLTNTKTNDVTTPPPTGRPVQTTPTMSLKNRRKGRAYKLQPEALRLQHEADKVRDDDMFDTDSDVSASTQSMTSANTHKCQHCDIIFGDLTMHIIHMGFHGYKDPFMCNKCGERCADRIAFFIHLGRGEHI